VLILPYLERTGLAGKGLKQLYDSYDFSEPWDGPHNRKLADRMPIVFGCWRDRDRRASETSYPAITGEHSAFPGSRSIRFDEIRDGKSNTILVIETGNSGINWVEPRDYPVEQLRLDPQQAPHPRLGDHWAGGRNAVSQMAASVSSSRGRSGMRPSRPSPPSTVARRSTQVSGDRERRKAIGSA
jgi:hypothetical protein